MANSGIKIKGTKDGVDIYMDTQINAAELLIDYERHLREGSSFFSGGRIKTVNIIGNFLSDEAKKQINDITQKYVDCDEILFVTMEDFRGHPLKKLKDKIKLKEEAKEEPKVKIAQTAKAFHKFEDVATRYIYGTVRSGDCVEFAGNVVVLGDVNAGAEIRATGSVYVLGILRGIAHAGYEGNTETFIYAECMMPPQIRIAHVIAKSPDDSGEVSLRPEIARISEDSIVIESAANKF